MMGLSSAFYAASDSFVVVFFKKKSRPFHTRKKEESFLIPLFLTTHQVSFQSSRNVHGTWMTSPGLPHPADC